MSNLIGNAFSAGMMDNLPNVVSFSEFSLEEARNWVAENNPSSCVGHADTAALISALLGYEVVMNRVSTSLKAGDRLLIAQYNGARLPEGATSLPEGARLRWILASIS